MLDDETAQCNDAAHDAHITESLTSDTCTVCVLKKKTTNGPDICYR